MNLEIQKALIEGIKPVMLYERAHPDWGRGGIGYRKGKLVSFKIMGERHLIAREITLLQSVEWLEKMQVGEIKTIDYIWESTWDDTARLRWYRELKAALKKPKD